MIERTFEGRKVMVTGASRGIGRAITEAFAGAGASVALVYARNAAAAEAVKERLPRAGHCLVQADLADPEQADRAVQASIDGLGGLDIVVNNAGIFDYHPIADTDLSAWRSIWRHTLDTNLVGPANVCYAAARYMMTRGGGRIVNVSSRGAFRGEPDAPAYGASKAGLNSLSQSLAVALAPHGIVVGVVAPGFIETDMARESLEGERGEAIRRQSPLGRVGRPEEVAKAVLFLAGDDVEFATGAILDVNGASYLRS
jgi:3-oxoacyl-[acyl-carrier protein] reductase